MTKVLNTVSVCILERSGLAKILALFPSSNGLIVQAKHSGLVINKSFLAVSFINHR